MYMSISLFTNKVAAFKVIGSFLFFSFALFAPVAALMVFIVLALGRAHSVGAWFGMWRSQRLTIKYLFSSALIMAVVGYWGFKMAPLHVLIFVSTVIFIFHFFFDEADFYKKEKLEGSLFSSAVPFLLITVYLFSSFLHLPIPPYYYYVAACVVFLYEIIKMKAFTWHFIQTKIVTIFILVCIGTQKGADFVSMAFLMYHYVFWFIYPVYQLHKHKPDERDGFIAILLLMVISSVLVYSGRTWDVSASLSEIVLRSFYIASTVHVFTTAPFATFLGLKDSYYGKAS